MINNTYHDLAKGNCKQESNAKNTVADLAVNKTQSVQKLFKIGARPTNYEEMNDSCEN